MKFDLNNDSHIQLILKDVYSADNDEYRKEIDKQWRILRGDLKHFVDEHLREIFPKTYASFTPSEINLASKISHKRAQAYKESPLRILSKDNETEAYNEIMKDVGAKWVWRDFDLYKNHLKSAAMWFSFYEKDGAQKIKLRALRPNQFSRVVNDKDETAAFVVHLGNSESSANRIDGDGMQSVTQDEPEDNISKDVAIWTESQHVVIRIESAKDGSTSFKRMILADNEDGVNQLGMIPAVFDQDGSEMERAPLNPLSNQTITLNYIMSVIFTAASSSAFGQLVISHPQEQPMSDTLQQGLFTFMKLPQVGGEEPATTADYINSSPDLQSMMEVFRLYAASILDEHGVKSEGIKGGVQEFASGIDRLLSNASTVEIVEANQESYAEKEQELFEIIKEFLSLTGQVNFSTEEIIVQYKKPRPMQSDTELLEIVEKKLQLGLIEEWEKFIVFNPNMSQDEAIKKLEAIEETKQSKMEMFINDESTKQSEQSFEAGRDESSLQEEQPEDEN